MTDLKRSSVAPWAVDRNASDAKHLERYILFLLKRRVCPRMRQRHSLRWRRTGRSHRLPIAASLKTLTAWKALEKANPSMDTTVRWKWNLCVLYYDATPRGPFHLIRYQPHTRSSVMWTVYFDVCRLFGGDAAMKANTRFWQIETQPVDRSA